MSGFQDAPTQDHMKLVESINQRVSSIYKQLCEYEESLDPSNLDENGDSHTNIMDLLETLESIKQTARFIHPHNLDLRLRQQSLEEQMKCLEQSVNLMQLETRTSDKS